VTIKAIINSIIADFQTIEWKQQSIQYKHRFQRHEPTIKNNIKRPMIHIITTNMTLKECIKKLIGPYYYKITTISALK
jgi:hypothetical protein